MTKPYLANLEATALEGYRGHALAVLLENYDMLSATLYDSDLSYLEYRYNWSVDGINISSKLEHIDHYLNSFVRNYEDYPRDPLRLAKYNSSIGLQIHYETLVQTATDDSVTDLAALLPTLLNNIQNAENVEAVNAALENAIVALDNAYVADPNKVALVNSKEDAYILLCGYVTFMQVFIPDWVIHHQMWDLCHDYCDDIEQASSTEQVRTLADEALVQLKALEVLDDEAVNDFRVEILNLIADEYNEVNEPTADQTNAYNDYRDQITAATHPYTMDTLANELYDILFS